MKIWVNLIFCLLLVMGWAAPVFAENWLSLGRGDMRPTWAPMEAVPMEAFIDMDSVKRFKNTVQFSQKTVFDSDYTTPKGITYIRLIGTVIIDCPRRTHAIVELTGYDRRGGKTYDWADQAWVWMEFPEPSAFQPILVGSFLDRIRTRLCR